MRVARVQIRVQIMAHLLKRKRPMSTTTIIIDEILDAGAKAMAEKWKPNVHGPLPLPEHLNVRVTHHLFNRMAAKYCRKPPHRRSRPMCTPGDSPAY